MFHLLDDGTTHTVAALWLGLLILSTDIMTMESALLAQAGLGACPFINNTDAPLCRLCALLGESYTRHGLWVGGPGQPAH